MKRACTKRALMVLVLGVLMALFACDDAQRGEAVAPPDPLAVQFTPGGGIFLGSTSVSLAVSRPDAQLRYTVDGSLPSAASPLYVGPIAIEESTRVRALALVPEAGATGTSGPVGAQTYIRAAADTQGFTTHLPVIVIHTFGSGELGTDKNEPYVPARLQVFEPVGGRTSLAGQATLDTRIGIHVRGESSRGFPKKQYAVELWDGADEDLDLPLLGMPAHSDWVVSDPIRMDRSMIRNAFVYEVSNSIGRYAPRTRFVEAFLIDGQNGTDLSMASFLGFFTVIEKIKRGQDRLNLAKLGDGDVVEPAVSGGYILRFDPGSNDFDAGGEEVQFVYPRSEVMGLPERAVQVEYLRSFINDFSEASEAPGGVHPESGKHFSEYIDQDAWVDHHIINALTKNPDGIHRSAYFHKARGGKLVAGPVWDFDRTLGTREDNRATDPEGWRPSFGYAWWRPLFDDDAFRQRYRSRAASLFQRELSPASLNAIVDRLALSVGDAARRNFERWPEDAPEDGHAAEIRIIKEFIRERVAWLQGKMSLPDFRD